MADKKLEIQLEEQWESIGISNDFIFCKVMQERELLEELVRNILPDLRFKYLEIRNQETIEIGRDIHGVRFDLLTTSEDGTIVEIEMQVVNRKYLAKRLRFYESAADMHFLDKGHLYSELKDSYIIMICPFDFFRKGRHIYTFTNRCKEDNSLELGDGTTKVILNAVGTLNDIDDRPRLKAFLDYVLGTVSEDEYIQKLDRAVQKARMNKDWRREYMTLMMRDLENKEIGREEGIEQGIEKGKAEGQQETTVSHIKNIMDSFGVGIEKAMDSLKIPQDQRTLYAELVNS